jgi:hypothetical protein
MNQNEVINKYIVGSQEIDKTRLAIKAEDNAKLDNTTVRYIYSNETEIVFHVIRTVKTRKNDDSYSGYASAKNGEFHFSRVVELKYLKGHSKPITKMLGVTYVALNRQIATWNTMPIMDNEVKRFMVASALWHSKHMKANRLRFDMRQTWQGTINAIVGSEHSVTIRENLFADIAAMLDEPVTESVVETPVIETPVKKTRKPRTSRKAK